MFKPSFKFSSFITFVCFFIFFSALFVGSLGSKVIINKQLDLVAAPAVITTTSFFDDFDNLNYIT